MLESLTVKAASKDKALKKALKEIPEEKNVKLRDLKITEEKKCILSMLKSKKKYTISIQKKPDIDFELLKDIYNVNKKLNLDIDNIVKYNLSTYQTIKNGKVVIKKSQNKMQAHLDYYPPGGYGKDLTKIEIRKKLEEENIRYGIKKENIEKIVGSDNKIEDILIAEGKEPKKGEDAELKFHFKRDKKSVGTFKENGSIDFYDLDIVNNVEKGEKLVTKIELKPGEEGKNIEGKVLKPEPVQDVALPQGKNTEVTEDNTLIASKVGHISYDKKKVNILTVYKVNGDVDFNTGNIDFRGSVFVKGNVTEGFKIKADGDIHIKGNVEGAYLKSSGDIIINKNFIAKNKGEINCGGDFKSKSIQNGIVNCQGDIYIQDAIMHSKIFSGGIVEVISKKGLIVGGEVRAATEIKANIIGSSLATKTIVSAGINPHIRSEYNQAKKAINECKSNYLKTIKAINILNQRKEKKGKLPASKVEMYDRLVETKSDLKDKIAKNEKIIKNLKEEIEDTDKGKITAKRKVYPGVKVQIGQYHKDIDEVNTRTVFKIKNGELRRFTL